MFIRNDRAHLHEMMLAFHKEMKRMEEEGKKPLSAFLRDAEVKVVWREDPNLDKPPKVGRGTIQNDDDNFVYLTGEKGTVIVNKKDIIAIKQLPNGGTK